MKKKQIVSGDTLVKYYILVIVFSHFTTFVSK